MSDEKQSPGAGEQLETSASDTAQAQLTPLEKFLYERLDHLETRLSASLEKLSAASTRLHDAYEAADALREERMSLIEDRLTVIENKLGLQRRPDALPRKRPNKTSIQ